MSTPTRKLTVNGQPTQVAATTVRDLLAELGYDPAGRGLAVALGDAVVPRAQWPSMTLEGGVAIEIVGATQGG